MTRTMFGQPADAVTGRQDGSHDRQYEKRAHAGDPRGTDTVIVGHPRRSVKSDVGLGGPAGSANTAEIIETPTLGLGIA